MTEALHYVAVS